MTRNTDIEALILTLFLKTMDISRELISAQRIKTVIVEARKFVHGKIWIQYDPSMEVIICRTVEVDEQ